MPEIPQTAQVTYTTNPILSPAVIGAVVTVIASLASAAGFHVLEDPVIQQQLILVIGLIGTALAHWAWPHNDGKLSFSAPLSTPPAQDIPAGSSVITVPKSSDIVQETDVKPLPVGEHTVIVAQPVVPLTTTPNVTILQGTG